MTIKINDIILKEIRDEAYFLWEKNKSRPALDCWLEAEIIIIGKYITPKMIVENEWGRQDL